MYLIACYVIGYGINFLMPNLFSYLTLEPYYIIRGQVWRIISWVLIPPGQASFWIIFMLFLYYSIGTTLERTWGAFRFNVYIFSGIIFTVIGAFILFFAFGANALMGGLFSTYYINMSMFLAFAASYPNMELRLYFVLPVKVKWLGIVYAGLIGYSFIMSSLVVRVAIIASLLSFLVFFFYTIKTRGKSPKQQAQKVKFTRESKPLTKAPGTAIHRCAVCGRTEQDDANLEFRYCSKCSGSFEYCQDHLFTHEHRK